MGNAAPVSREVKNQGQGQELYDLVNMKGGGTLIELMKKARETNDYTELDTEIDKIGEKYLYEDKDCSITVSELINFRNKNDKSKLDLFTNRIKQKKQDVQNSMKKQKATVFEQKNDICWKIDKRGTVGETILHLCFLNISRAHSDLAKRLIKKYPKIINDIYAGDEYYGENVLHMAIVNEDPAMVKFLLDHGADCRSRACGNFFFPDDQKKSRTDNPYHEWVDVSRKTNYEGHVYLGEYPLSFAACLGQEECVRLLIAKDRSINSGSQNYLANLQDANGNTVLHMLVIQDKKSMFDIVYELGGSLNIRNRQGLTPLTLAAKLARKDMYEHILEKERKEFWKYGNVTCAGYPLDHIDTISTGGEINFNSALNLIVYGEEQGHIDMMEGLVENLLREKWKTFIRYRFYRRFIVFSLYFLAFTAAFFLRPGKDLCLIATNTTNINYCDIHAENRTMDPCYLLVPYRNEDIVRLTLEVCVLVAAIVYILLSMREIKHQGFKCFFNTLVRAPAKALFLLSCIFVLLMLPGRASCSHQYEDYMAVFAILCTAPYFLFFCRGFRTVGPFVVMIYKMIKGDLLRFVIIYVIFLIGFSQAMFIVFREVENSPFNSIGESIVAMFVMSVGQFADFYDSLIESKHMIMGRIIFMVYMVLVTLLLVNMLIAMMGNTYQLIASTEKEWLRQWAKIVLVVEQSVSEEKRLLKQKLYSEPSSSVPNGRVLVVRSHQTDKDREEEERLRQFHKQQQKKKKKKIKIRQISSPQLFSESDAAVGKINI
ncbi:hypothetical protein LOTGIDRAFT_216486 [Lottia gigantea]|uniref:Ion transport domain-containing protein n=1 Tax=Lottia gigantea TaxID=225164 RepID=V3ZN78_LOTGI|nr:hypothetical protein LOTGIDRAFT_216486 [Lottia gigantea]ESO92828.1 hypothetical protein LOTGIDRAFT_216486 [Lottia gigantea]